MTNLSGDNLEQIIKDSDKPVFVDMYADWCGPCKMLTPLVEELAKEYDGKVTFIKVNVDENPESSAAYGVRSIPTLFVFDKGKVVKKQVGAIPKSKIVEMFKDYIV